MDVPNVRREEFTVVNIDDAFLNLMTAEGAEKNDVKVPEGEIGDQIRAGFDEEKELIVTVIAAMGEEAVITFKEAPKGA